MGSRSDRLAEEVAARQRIAERGRERRTTYDPAELVGAVVVTFGDGPHIGHLLRRLATEVAAIAVVDLSSADDTVAEVERALPGLEPVALPTRAGYGAAINTGARLLDTPYLLVLHGDTRPRPDAIGVLLQTVAAEGRRVGCAGGRIIAPHGELEPSAGFRPTPLNRAQGAVVRRLPRLTMYYLRRPAAFVPHARSDVGWVSDIMLLVRREAFDEVGGMDEGYFSAGLATDFGMRLRAKGWRVVHEIRAGAIHLDVVEESPASVRRARRRLAAAHGVLRRLHRQRD